MRLCVIGPAVGRQLFVRPPHPSLSRVGERVCSLRPRISTLSPGGRGQGEGDGRAGAGSCRGALARQPSGRLGGGRGRGDGAGLRPAPGRATPRQESRFRLPPPPRPYHLNPTHETAPMPKMSTDKIAALGYVLAMSMLAVFLRMLIVAVFAAGLGLPATAVGQAWMSGTHLDTVHHAPNGVSTAPQDEACRQYCPGETMLVAPSTPAPCNSCVAPVQVAAQQKDGPSLRPQPEGHPPRS